ncbi:MAG TPA: M64 family metallopeptidase [Polyangiaceae bacterium]|nr:M64 family metallopeptidase [Polyangiaceae bacterium]
MRRAVAGAALAVAWLAAASAGAAEVESLRMSGPAADRFNIAVLGDGYRAEDQTKLKTDAQGIIDYLFSVPPLKQYAAFFNVKLVHVISNENGADNGNTATRDTALGAHFNCDNIDRLLCIDDGAAAVAAAQDVPEYNFAIVIVNDPKYGGSGGPVCASSSNEQSFEVLAHEIGHSLAHLADEYSYEGNQPPCSQQADCREANATLRTSLDQIKWKDWIEQGTPLPTPATDQYGKITGLFEGTRYTPLGVYRPQLNCKMRDLGADYCSVCTEQFVRSIWTAENIKMIEQTTPARATVQSVSCDAVELSVKSPPITPSTYRYTWSVDGQPQTETTNEISLLPGALKQGDHQVVVTVEDATALVRSDPDGILKDEFTWTVSVTKSDCPAEMPGGGGGGAGGGGAGGALGGGGGGGAAAGGLGGASSTAGESSVAGTSSAAGAGGSARPTPPPLESSGCGCSVPRSSSTPTAALLAWTLGLVLAGRRSAQRRSSHR